VVDVLSTNEEGILDGLREQRDAVEELIDDVVQGYHNGFNRAIHNYSQVIGQMRLFDSSALSRRA
jgi:exocyst complex component 4